MKIEFVLEEGEEITPLKICQALVEHGEEFKNADVAIRFGGPPTYIINTFDRLDLRELANHLLVYCDCQDKREENK